MMRVDLREERTMITVLALSAIPAVLAAGFDSFAMALLAVAGLVWAAALYVCSVAPVVSGQGVSITETVATGLSATAAVVAALGLLLLLTPAI
jgi:hypothetical protein